MALLPFFFGNSRSAKMLRSANGFVDVNINSTENKQNMEIADVIIQDLTPFVDRHNIIKKS